MNNKFSTEVISSVNAVIGTEFPDLKGAKLNLEIKNQVEKFTKIFPGDFDDEEKKAFAPVRQRLVRTNEFTGRKSIFLSSHIGSIIGWEIPEARDLIRELMEHATSQPFVYRHSWSVGDLVVWDNRQCMHRVRRFDDASEPRDMRRTTIAGTAKTVPQSN